MQCLICKVSISNKLLEWITGLQGNKREKKQRPLLIKSHDIQVFTDVTRPKSACSIYSDD